MNTLRLIYSYTVSDPARAGAVRVTSCNIDQRISPFLPENCELLQRIAKNKIKETEGEGTKTYSKLQHCSLSTWFDASGQHFYTDAQIRQILTRAGIHRLTLKSRPTEKDWMLCTPETVEQAIAFIIQPVQNPKTTKKQKREKETPSPRHKAADALDWSEANRLMQSLYEDGQYRDCLLVAAGCYLGLRISDLLLLKWKDILNKEEFTTREKKTKKVRTFRLNPSFQKIILACHKHLGIEHDDIYIFCSPGTDGTMPISRQRADQILKRCKRKYHLKSAKTFSTHSLRKTFGRRVWLRQCEKGRGEQALLLLCDVFGHSSVQITKRYLGIRQEEILSVYDCL